jgi:hypothetical protein
VDDGSDVAVVGVPVAEVVAVGVGDVSAVAVGCEMEAVPTASMKATREDSPQRWLRI